MKKEMYLSKEKALLNGKKKKKRNEKKRKGKKNKKKKERKGEKGAVKEERNCMYYMCQILKVAISWEYCKIWLNRIHFFLSQNW